MQDSYPTALVITQGALHPVIVLKLHARFQSHLNKSGGARDPSGGPGRVLVMYLIVDWLPIHLTQVDTILQNRSRSYATGPEKHLFIYL